MHLHILGICGTFMGGIALIARAMGHKVTGSDANVYPPMSTQLEEAGIELMQGYEPGHLQPAPDVVVVGNAMSRGNAAVEYMLEQGLRYVSGPRWLSQQLLRDRWVLAVAGTHGKTTTASMLAWILEHAGLRPGFLIGGVPLDFGLSARLGDEPFFVIEADEYDTAFFDKRSKFVHYHPRTLVLNNLEFDHADIFDDLGQIQRQFEHLLRIVPGNGLVIAPEGDANLREVIERGCWSGLQYVGGEEWRVRPGQDDHGRFTVLHQGEPVGTVDWGLTGAHNSANALAALLAARHAGVAPSVSCEALSAFRNVKRRMELRGEVGGVRVYDDFAHHPTAIATTLAGLRAQVGEARILAVLEPRSNTMKRGIHADQLADSLRAADRVLMYASGDLGWDPERALAGLGERATVYHKVQDIVQALADEARAGDQILVMSNGGFEGIHGRILDALPGATA